MDQIQAQVPSLINKLEQLGFKSLLKYSDRLYSIYGECTCSHSNCKHFKFGSLIEHSQICYMYTVKSLEGAGVVQWQSVSMPSKNYGIFWVQTQPFTPELLEKKCAATDHTVFVHTTLIVCDYL